LSTGGCRMFEARESQPPQVPVQQPTVQPEAEPVAKPDLATAMDLLENGRGEAARKLLAALAEDAPRSRVLTSLLRQIDEPVEQLLPGPYRQVQVDGGESLSLIAARELGDPLMFYALARLNGIDVPAQVPVGTVLKVPETAGGDEDENLIPPASADAPSEVTVAEIESVARYLARSGQDDQARAMLIGKLGESEGAGVESARELLATLTLEQASEMRASGAYARAIEAVDETLAVMGESGQRQVLADAREGIRSEMLLENAVRLREQGELVAAYQVARKAADMQGAGREATGLVDELRAEIVDSLHNEALVAWRDRNVDLAIRTWESLLDVIPDFEPARVYLERARLLRERLDEPREQTGPISRYRS
ncbi:MAG TPA: hypothetical protein VLA37_07190, partial [Sphingomonadaceae bacterium]|nr:hypothetical protein [Sphingomonadaceae bacterium]